MLQLRQDGVMGPRLRRWTRPCQASRGDLPLPLGRSPTFWTHIQEDSRREHSRARPAGSGLDLGGQQTSRVLKGLSCPLFRDSQQSFNTGIALCLRVFTFVLTPDRPRAVTLNSIGE